MGEGSITGFCSCSRQRAIALSLLLMLWQHGAQEGFNFLKCSLILQIWLRKRIYPKQNKTSGSPQGRTVRAQGTSFLPGSLEPLLPTDPPLAFAASRSPSFRGAGELPAFGTSCHPAQFPSEAEAETWASQRRVPFSAFCSGRAGSPRRGRAGAFPAQSSAPAASRRAPACFCCTCGWMWESLITRDYCSIMSFPTAAAALDTKVGHVRCCACAGALMRGGRGRPGQRMEGWAGAWLVWGRFGFRSRELGWVCWQGCPGTEGSLGKWRIACFQR